MDDTEDDGRYPPNRRSPFPSSHRPKLPVRNSSFPPPFSGNYAAADEDDEEKDERNDVDQAMDDPEAEDDDEEEEHAGGSYRRARDDVDDDEDDSSESLGKRRKLDKFAHGFEFAPRVTAAAAAAAAAASPAVKPTPPSARSSPAEWSEDSTFVLLDAWGEFYLQNGRKSIRSDEWSEVAKRVCRSSRNSRSDAQCRNRLDTLKKKYKKEKSKMAENVNLGSEWVYFSKMDSLMSSPPPSSPVVARKPQQQKPPRLACGVDAGEYVFSSSKAYENGTDEMRDSPGDTESEDDGVDDDDDDDDESDGLPPKMRKASWGSESSFRILADSIQKFGDIYEKIEIGKRQQMAELERMRKEFQRDLEVQKRQILERAQEEIAKIREEEGEEEEEEEEEDEGGERAEDDDDDDGDEADDST